MSEESDKTLFLQYTQTLYWDDFFKSISRRLRLQFVQFVQNSGMELISLGKSFNGGKDRFLSLRLEVEETLKCRCFCRPPFEKV